MLCYFDTTVRDIIVSEENQNSEIQADANQSSHSETEAEQNQSLETKLEAVAEKLPEAAVMALAPEKPKTQTVPQEDVITLSRTTVNYVVIALVFLVVGIAIGSFGLGGKSSVDEAA